MTSAVGPADVSVDRSTLTGQRSTVKVGCGQRAPPVSLNPRLTHGPHGSGQNRKRGKGSVFYWAQRRLGRLEAQLSTARLAVQLGIQLGLRLSRPARAAGWLRVKNGSA
jgi:hypothetical protein